MDWCTRSTSYPKTTQFHLSFSNSPSQVRYSSRANNERALLTCIIHLKFIMASNISKTAFRDLGKKIRENAETLKNLTFADNATAQTVVKTRDLRLDVHKNTQDPAMATGIIQANSQATDKTVKDLFKGKTGGHRGNTPSHW